MPDLHGTLGDTKRQVEDFITTAIIEIYNHVLPTCKYKIVKSDILTTLHLQLKYVHSILHVNGPPRGGVFQGHLGLTMVHAPSIVAQLPR